HSLRSSGPIMVALLTLAGLALLPTGAAAQKGKAKAPVRPQTTAHAYMILNGTLVEGCDDGCLKRTAQMVRGRKGIRSATVKGGEIELEVVPGVFTAEEAIRKIDGFKVEMRVPYKRAEIHFIENAPFPPWPRLDGDVLVIDFGDDVRKAIESGLQYKPNPVMKCVGKVLSGDANEAVLMRYEVEKRPPLTMIPFMTEGDFDGDKRPDVYLRFEGLGEMVIFNTKNGLKAASPRRQQYLEEIPRCDQTPTRYARTVPGRRVRCESASKITAVGDAIERVDHNQSAQLLAWNGTAFEECDAYGGDGPMPEELRREGQESTFMEVSPKRR
ncbi:MAG: hypothetical protein ACK4N5_02935, partial [Myxococcales bacterium]